VNRADSFALVEYFELKPAYLAVISKHPAMNNRSIRVGFATRIDSEQLSPLLAESAILDRRRPPIPVLPCITIEHTLSSSDSDS
jgi:hypothetical protein